MKQILSLFIVVFFLQSCNKKYSFEIIKEDNNTTDGSPRTYFEKKDIKAKNDSLAYRSAYKSFLFSKKTSEDYQEAYGRKLFDNVIDFELYDEKGVRVDNIVLSDKDEIEEQIMLEENYFSNSSKQTKEIEVPPYEMMEVAFEGYPSREEIKPLLETVMTRYGFEITDKNLLRCASVLVTLRKESILGITEMDILKHMYQKGSDGIDYPTQAAISFRILESSK